MKKKTIPLTVITAILLLTTATAEIDYTKGRIEMSNQGWTKKTDTMKFTCDGAADLRSTKC
ncbi:MAG: hypothetical protein KAU03_07195, partial [Candidatus Altiarchaeales archaeon]|nr:hypothetical protein [Candidatus Altiarchaeales archaeon]